MGYWVHIIKHQRLLHLKQGSTIIKSYSISLGKQPIGKKEFEGDEKTPEGEYTIYHKSEKSEFYKSLGISYPNPEEKAFAAQLGKSPGGQIRIHGVKNNFDGNQPDENLSASKADKKDWTSGCIALTNAEMDEIFEIIQVGTPVFIEA